MFEEEDGVTTKKIHTELISGDDFQRQTEAEIGEQQEPGWQMIRRRRRSKAEDGRGNVDASVRERDSDSLVDVIRCDSFCKVVGGRKRQRTDVKKTNGRERQGHQKEVKINEEKMENDEEKREKEMEHEIRVVTWNVNKSSAHYDFLSDMAQCQANVVMTQNWQADGTDEDLGWTLLRNTRKVKPLLISGSGT